MHKWIALIFVFIITFSCDTKNEAGEMKSIVGGWNINEEVQFTLPKLDSLKKYDMFLHLRNTNDYPYNNIFLIVNMSFPHGKMVTDTLEYRMAAPDGTWLGNGIGDVKESKLWYKEGVTFFESGNYSLFVSQAVRNNGKVGGVSALKGITEVGYSIQEATD